MCTRIILAVALLVPSQQVTAQGVVDWTSVVRTARSSVLTLKAYDSAGELVGLGSGFRLVDGRIVTNLHVVGGAVRIEAFGPEGDPVGTLSYADALSTSADLAILPAPGESGPGLVLADIEPEVGEPVVVIGSPQGLSSTVSDGLVSAFRTEGGVRLMQISAPISPGSSGGPVLNRRGEVVGVSVASIRDGQNLNFAVPLRSVRVIARSPTGHLAFPAGQASSSTSSTATAHGTSRNAAGGSAADLPPVGSLTLGEAATGTLTTASFHRDGYYANLHAVSVKGGHAYTVVAISSDFDVAVDVGAMTEAGTLEKLATDDDGAGGTNAMAVVTPTSSGVLVVAVTSYDTLHLGSYRLAVFEGDRSDAIRQTVSRPGDSRWVYAVNTGEADVFIDRQTVRIDSRGVVTAWEDWRYHSVKRDSWATYDKAKILRQIDCRGKRARPINAVYYLDGAVQDSGGSSSRGWDPLVPGSVGETIGEVACSVAAKQ